MAPELEEESLNCEQLTVKALHESAIDTPETAKKAADLLRQARKIDAAHVRKVWRCYRWVGIRHRNSGHK